MRTDIHQAQAVPMSSLRHLALHSRRHLKPDLEPLSPENDASSVTSTIDPQRKSPDS